MARGFLDIHKIILKKLIAESYALRLSVGSHWLPNPLWLKFRIWLNLKK
jgi:hypothetical protein